MTGYAHCAVTVLYVLLGKNDFKLLQVPVHGVTNFENVLQTLAK